MHREDPLQGRMQHKLKRGPSTPVGLPLRRNFPRSSVRVKVELDTCAAPRRPGRLATGLEQSSRQRGTLQPRGRIGRGRSYSESWRRSKRHLRRSRSGNSAGRFTAHFRSLLSRRPVAHSRHRRLRAGLGHCQSAGRSLCGNDQSRKQPWKREPDDRGAARKVKAAAPHSSQMNSREFIPRYPLAVAPAAE
jgi:hypothetical protein